MNFSYQYNLLFFKILFSFFQNCLSKFHQRRYFISDFETELQTYFGVSRDDLTNFRLLLYGNTFFGYRVLHNIFGRPGTESHQSITPHFFAAAPKRVIFYKVKKVRHHRPKMANNTKIPFFQSFQSLSLGFPKIFDASTRQTCFFWKIT